MDTSLTPETLLQHGRFVRELARSLVRDPHLADDVAQETWTRWLERPPRAAERPKSWLRAVVRSLALNTLRARGRRAEHEQLAHRREVPPSPADESEQVDLLRRVVEAVVELDEPYRNTILALHFRGLDARALAQQSGVPLATDRSREQRALVKLRERLDRQLGGRAAWVMALGKLLVLDEPVALPAATMPAASMAIQAGVAAVVVLAGVMIWRATSSSGGPGTTGSRLGPEGSLASTPGGDASALGVPATEPARGLVRPEHPLPEKTRAAVPGARSRTSTESAPLRGETCEIRGRFLLPGGAPATGLAVDIDGYADDWRDLESGDLEESHEPEGWEDPSGLTDDDGRFSIVFVPPPAFRFELDARRQGLARERWSWNEILPGEVKDIGEVELRPGGNLEGRLLYTNGAPVLVAYWEVHVEGNEADASPGGERLWESTDVDSTTGGYRFEDLPAGSVRLSAARSGSRSIAGPAVAVVAGQTVTADITYHGPDLSKRIRVLTFAPVATATPPFMPCNPELQMVHISGEGIEPRTAAGDTTLQDPGSIWFDDDITFDGLAPGEYTIQIDDPRFLPWSQSGVTPGSIVWAKLEASSALTFDVRDADGKVLPLYTVESNVRNVNYRPDRFLLYKGAEPLPGGRLTGIIAGDYTITVSVVGLGKRTLDVEDLLAGETRALSFVFGPPTTLAGRVLQSDGTPFAGAPVLLLASAVVEDSPASPIQRRTRFNAADMSSDPGSRRELSRTRSDAGGAFRFELPGTGSYALCTWVNESIQVASASVTLAGGEHRSGVDLVLPPSGSVRGRIRGVAGSPLRGLRVSAEPTGTGSLFGLEQPRAVELAGDGHYELGPLPVGPAQVFLVLPERTLDELLVPLGGAVPLGVVQIRAGETTRADFDASETLPGTASVTVLVNGSPAAGLEVTLLDPAGERLDSSQGLTDLEGRASLSIFPGSWHLEVRDNEVGWVFSLPTTVAVSAAHETRVVVPVELFTGRVTCVDASSGVALSRQEVVLSLGTDGAWELKRLKTDLAGSLELSLPVGDYGLARSGQDTPQPLIWTVNGPLTAQVEL